MKLTNDQYLLLSQLSYIDIHEVGNGATIKEKTLPTGNHTFSTPKTLGEICDSILTDPQQLTVLSNSNFNKDDLLQVVNSVANDPSLSSMQMVACANDNGNTGLMAYAFETQNGNDRVYAFRGSEGENMLTAEDWVDNWTSGASGSSRQNDASIAFVDEVNAKLGTVPNNHATGHSLGGSNAMAVAGARGMDGAAFDARGVALDTVKNNPGFNDRYNQSGFESIRTEGDIVSMLDHVFWRPDKETTVPSQIFYDENGNPVKPLTKAEIVLVNWFVDDLAILLKVHPDAGFVISALLAGNLLSDFINGFLGLGDIYKYFETLGMSVLFLLRLPALLAALGIVIYKHRAILLVLFARGIFGGNPKQSIFGAHYTQALTGSVGGNYDIRNKVHFASLAACEEDFRAAQSAVQACCEEVNALCGQIQSDSMGMSIMRIYLKMLMKDMEKSAEKMTACADGVRDAHHIMLETEKRVFQSFDIMQTT